MVEPGITDDRAPPGVPFDGRIPVVGIGASAGGLVAIEDFLSHVPPDPGVAFVVVTHQHPDHPSLLHELLGRKTTMPVHLQDGDATVEPGHVYVAAPGRTLTIVGDQLIALERDPSPSLYLPIDLFFRSLARARGDRAIGVILSGTGSDGTLGIEDIKAALGMVMAQDEADASYPGMPHSAIETGMVDYVLPAQEMPARLLGYLEGADHLEDTPAQSSAAQGFEGIFSLLQRHTGNDFSHYKISTIRRRIERRMNIRHLSTVAAYLERLDESPEEVELLFHDLLIGVTSFFRDPEAFEGLAAHLPELLERQGDERALRVWVPGCSTGEEAYSIAMLLCEQMDAPKRPFEVQIFASDLDPNAIDTARKGTYPLGIAHHVTPERLERFFTRVGDVFRIKKEVRALVVFSIQNVIADPPFTKLDLVSCRNVLIYLDSSLQQRLLPMFHYALQPGGLLLLGSSESLGGFGSLFEAIDKKWKIFRRSDDVGSHFVSELPRAVRLSVPESPNSTVPTERPPFPRPSPRSGSCCSSWCPPR